MNITDEDIKRALVVARDVLERAGDKESIWAVRVLARLTSMKTKVFHVVSSGQDEYPGDGLYLRVERDKQPAYNNDKFFLDAMGLEVEEDDEIEIRARVVSRMKKTRVPVEE